MIVLQSLQTLFPIECCKFSKVGGISLLNKKNRHTKIDESSHHRHCLSADRFQQKHGQGVISNLYFVVVVGFIVICISFFSISHTSWHGSCRFVWYILTSNKAPENNIIRGDKVLSDWCLTLVLLLLFFFFKF